MASSSFCSSSSSSSLSVSNSLSPHPHPPFTPIQECEREGKEDDELSCDQNSLKAPTTPSDYSDINNENNYVHQPTPLHSKTATKSSKKRSDDKSVSCNKCRPSVREKFSVVPLDTTIAGHHSITSPNGLFKSIFSSIVRKSPRSTSSSSETLTPVAAKEDQWKGAVAELSHKLIQATKKRDEAILEASRLKFSMAELEKKLNKLEVYCYNLKSGLEDCTNNKSNPIMKHEPIKIGDHDKVIEHFLVSVSESRSSMRHLSRSLTVQLPQIAGGKLYDRIQLLLQPYDIKVSVSTNQRILILYLEALLNRAFFEDFESPGFQKSGSNRTLNPIHRCEENFKSFIRLKELSWEEVLNKGTKQFSEEFSKFCDRKMSEVVSMLGWTRAWPEPLLQAFFGASKAVWLVHLLANSVHPGLPIFRVDKGVRFDSIYMEDMSGDKAKRFMSSTVRVMVEPGFYIYGNVVKCKVICRYQSNNGFINVSPNSNPL
ncbi:IRK-interacting protein-like [Rutidosis leptorrhynchoides]|uniref:IRK-interacting protein-like n=1 Tax=Rutidosis leptorrhynchoides TaxID=125765 RepID=UPI003A99507C